jgi:GTP-binding protein HflX
LHVVDASNPDHPEQIESVMSVLRDIGAADVPQMLVFNKLDALPAERLPHKTLDSMELHDRSVDRIFVSAHTTAGLPDLREHLAQWVLQRSPPPHADLGIFSSDEPMPS